MRILFFGTYDARRHPRIRTLQEGLAALGDEVVECNAPLGLDTAARVRILQRPWLLPILAARLASCWWRLWRTSRTVGTVDAVVVGYLGHFDVHLARLLWRRVPIALDHMISARDTAADRGVRAGWMLRLLGRVDIAALRACDIPFVDTDEHLDLMPERERRRAVVVPVGAPAAWFGSPMPSEGTRLRVVFFGLFIPLQGAPVIGRALDLVANDDILVTMIGTGQDLATTKAAAAHDAHVTWIDWVDPEALPALVAGNDVCLGIFGTTPKALRVVPNKVYQGAAAGCAVVTSDTKPQRRAFGDAAVFVQPGDAEALADALRRLAAQPEELQSYRTAAAARAVEAFRPEVVVAPLQDRLAGARR